MKQKKKKVSTSILNRCRKIHIGSTVWYWRFRGSGVWIVSPEMKKVFVKGTELFPGIHQDTIEGLQYKHNYHVRPFHVKKYIERTFLGVEV